MLNFKYFIDLDIDVGMIIMKDKKTNNLQKRSSLHHRSLSDNASNKISSNERHSEEK
jgi:hypothetical protein